MVMNPLTRKLRKDPTGAKVTTFKSSHEDKKHIRNIVTSTKGPARDLAYKRELERKRKESIFGKGLKGAESNKKSSDSGSASLASSRKGEFDRNRIDKDTAEFFLKQKAQREKDSKSRQKNQIERELHDIEQKTFLIKQKVSQLMTDDRRNEMDRIHAAGLKRRYDAEVGRYNAEIVKYESVIREYNRQIKRSPGFRNPLRIRQEEMRNVDLKNKIRLIEGNIRRVKTLSHGVETKVKMIDEGEDARIARQKGYKRDIDAFSKELVELEQRGHILKQQLRYLNM